MNPEVVAVMDNEDLNRWRVACANREILEFGVAGISPTEAKQYTIDYYRILGEFYGKYNLQLDHNYEFSPANGAVVHLGVTIL